MKCNLKENIQKMPNLNLPQTYVG